MYDNEDHLPLFVLGYRIDNARASKYINILIMVMMYTVVTSFLQPFKPSRYIKASFYILKNRFNFPTTRGFRMTISMKLFQNTWQFSIIFNPLQVIFIHYKSRLATAIRG